MNSESMGAYEWRQNMIKNWRERIQVIFSQQNPPFEPLPSWSEVPTRPVDPWDIKRWERDNHARNYWSNRLNGGYIQTDIYIRESPYDTPPEYIPLEDHTWETCEEFDWFNTGYDGIDELYAPTNPRVDVWEEDMNLDLLFGDIT
jgi:hypothetical protein